MAAVITVITGIKTNDTNEQTSVRMMIAVLVAVAVAVAVAATFPVMNLMILDRLPLCMIWYELCITIHSMLLPNGVAIWVKDIYD